MKVRKKIKNLDTIRDNNLVNRESNNMDIYRYVGSGYNQNDLFDMN